MTRDCLFLLSLPPVGAGPAKRNSLKQEGGRYGQGPDFLLKEHNRLGKHWMFNKETPTEEQWLQSSATLTFFEKVRKFN